MIDERWLPVVGYEGLYAISDLGRVKSLARRVRSGKPNGRLVCERILKIQSVAGYPAISLRRQDRCVSAYVHSMILEAFVGPRPYKHEALHGDGNRKNSVLANLRWGTAKENAADMVRHGTAVYWNNPVRQRPSQLSANG